uniref:Transposable element n=2 Tax=Ixodes ricinus TaxID=34613 RepID=A0A131Y834_IXORI
MACPVSKVNVDSLQRQFSITVTDTDIEKRASRLPAVTYVAGYCAHVTLKKVLWCPSCKQNLVMEDAGLEKENILVASMTRGALKFPQAIVVNAVLFMEIVLDKLRSPQFATEFFALPNQREVLVALTSTALSEAEDLDQCDFGHSRDEVMHRILSAAANTLLNNLCKTLNNKLSTRKEKRKLDTVKP